MPNYFQLLRDGVAVSFDEIDAEMCTHFGVACHPKYYFEGWYIVIGPALAAGRSFDEIRLANADAPRLVEIATWLESRFTVCSGYSARHLEARQSLPSADSAVTARSEPELPPASQSQQSQQSAPKQSASAPVMADQLISVRLFECGSTILVLADVIAVQCAKFTHVHGGLVPSCLAILRNGQSVVLEMPYSRAAVGAVRAHHAQDSVFESRGTIFALADVSAIYQTENPMNQYCVMFRGSAGGAPSIYIDAEYGSLAIAALRAYILKDGGQSMQPIGEVEVRDIMQDFTRGES